MGADDVRPYDGPTTTDRLAEKAAKECREQAVRLVDQLVEAVTHLRDEDREDLAKRVEALLGNLRGPAGIRAEAVRLQRPMNDVSPYENTDF